MKNSNDIQRIFNHDNYFRLYNGLIDKVYAATRGKSSHIEMEVISKLQLRIGPSQPNLFGPIFCIVWELQFKNKSHG